PGKFRTGLIDPGIFTACHLNFANRASRTSLNHYCCSHRHRRIRLRDGFSGLRSSAAPVQPRSEEHTSELQSRGHLVCRLLLEKKKSTKNSRTMATLRAFTITCNGLPLYTP